MKNKYADGPATCAVTGRKKYRTERAAKAADSQAQTVKCRHCCRYHVIYPPKPLRPAGLYT